MMYANAIGIGVVAGLVAGGGLRDLVYFVLVRGRWIPPGLPPLMMDVSRFL
jgi:hypothetical protein